MTHLRICDLAAAGFVPATKYEAKTVFAPGSDCFAVARVGVEPTASLVLSQGGLPVAYRAVVDLHQCPKQDSNLQTSGFKPDRSADWRIWA